MADNVKGGFFGFRYGDEGGAPFAVQPYTKVVNNISVLEGIEIFLDAIQSTSLKNNVESYQHTVLRPLGLIPGAIDYVSDNLVRLDFSNFIAPFAASVVFTFRSVKKVSKNGAHPTK